MEACRICQIQCSVVTGFEDVALSDIRRRYDIEGKSNRGNVVLSVPFPKLQELTKVGAIDNFQVIMSHFPNVHFKETQEECFTQLKELVSKVDWKEGLSVWREFFTFNYPISHTPPKEVGKNASLDENSDESGIPRKKEKSSDPTLPAFRVTCYRPGEKKLHPFGSPDAAAQFGGAVQDYFNWNVSMKKHDIEVILHIDDQDVTVSIALTRQSQHRRNIQHFRHTTLRSTIAYNMLSFCDIQAGDVVCDPMCGSGVIPMESVLNWPESMHLCGDLEDTAWSKSKMNFQSLNEARHKEHKATVSCDVFQWDSCRLPLKDEAVDVFITDLPFGKRCGSHKDNRKLYPEALKELARVCRQGTGRACLLSHDRNTLVRAMSSMDVLWRRGKTITTTIGGLISCCYLLHRTNLSWSEYNMSNKS